MKPTVYSVPQRALHWLTALLIFYSLLFPGEIEHVVDLYRDGKVPSPADASSANIHIIIGFTIIGLTVLRLILRAVQGAPEAPAKEPPIFRKLAAAAHGLLYLLLFAMPAAGILKYYYGVGAAGFVHGGPMKLALWILVVAHVGAVFAHKFYWKTNVLERMTRG